MNWLKRLIVKWVREDWDDGRYSKDSGVPINLAKSATLGHGRALDSDATLNFTVYNAIGGKVIEFRRYDRKTDRSEHSVYVVGKDEDFGEKISKIATLEVMK